MCPFLLPTSIHLRRFSSSLSPRQPRTLHCGLTFNNIMCRTIKEINAEGETDNKAYGMLTGYTKTSQLRTGSRPYMAQELLKGTNDIHLYWHDAEALFCITLLMLTCHMVGRGEGVGNHTRDLISTNWATTRGPSGELYFRMYGS